MTEVEQPPQNGIDLSAAEDDDSSKARPADIEQDMREMERRKRVEAIMSSKLFREELERIVDSARDGGGASGILQQLSDIVGIPATRVGSVYKASNCMMPINDIRGVESMGYAKGEKILRCKLAATFRLLDLYGWTQGLGAQITARLKVDQEYFLVNPYGLLYHEITASALNKVDMQGSIVEQGTTNFGVNKNHFALHSVVHAARPDIRCAIYIGCSPVVAISSLKTGLLPITKDACVLGELSTHAYAGALLDTEERDKLVRSLGPNSKVLLLTNYGALCCGETIEEAFFAACHIVQACETQLKLLPVGVDNLVLIPEESRKIIYEQSRRPPEDLEKKFAAVTTGETTTEKEGEAATVKIGAAPKWRVGGAEFEALMRMLDNAGYRTGYIYRHPLVKSDPPKPKNDVELPPAVSSLGYLLEEEELFRQGIWKKGDLRKGGDRSRWLNSPNVYQKVEVLETGTPDPKKITKWVAESSPTHSTPVRIEDPLQFVPPGTNPKEFKRLQQQIKDNRRADKISAGPQSHILEGVTWDEANRIKDATVSSAGDHVVLMGAASKGIIQRGYQHNATVYKAPYAKNPFDNVTDDELNEYKRTVERKKKSIHGEYTDTDFSESEALSSLQTSGAQQTKQTTTTTTAAVSQSEPEDVSEHQVIRIQTQQAPVPSQPEVVLSDVYKHQQHLQKMHKNQKNIFIMQKPLHIVSEHMQQQIRLAQKYAFLYERPVLSANCFNNNIYACIHLFMIHKIDIFPQYTYPLADANTNHSNLNQHNSDAQNVEYFAQAANNNNTSSLSPTIPPYRTVSHYGFNYPLTYLPNIAMHPANLLSAVELQRQKVIAFIKSTAMMSLVENDLAVKANFKQQKELKRVQQATLMASDNETLLETAVKNTDINLKPKANDNDGSFISVKNIQLDTKRKPQQRRRHSKSTNNTNYSCSNNAISSSDEQYPHEHDEALSAQFSSLFSLGASYPAASHSHSADLLMPEQHHDHVRDHVSEPDNFDDSADNYSNVTAPRHAASENLYRSYVLCNFLPINHSTRARSYDHEIQHKPEAEQALHIDIHNDNNAHDKHQSKHITLSLNSLKRRAHHITAASVSETASHSQTDSCSNASVKSLEIHINISIKNSDYVKNLQTHEQEFKAKLEKVIDDEINLISQQLTADTAQAQLHIKSVNKTENHSSASTVRAKDCMHDTVHTSAGLKQSQCHTMTLLEHELENLLNSIIRANELHNRAIMCDCKTKIRQITENIRSSLNTDKIEH